jgi:tetratricopeptide (TPR) repeat protein
LAAVARAADPDPGRNGLRAAFGRPPGEAAAALKKLAANGKFLEQQSAASLVLLAGRLKAVGEGARSAAVLRSAWQRFPGDFWVNFDLGLSLWSDSNRHYERPEEAVRFLTVAVAARPSSFATHYNLGKALYLQGKLDESIAASRQAVKLYPKGSNAHYMIGLALFKQGKLDEAIGWFRKAIKLYPEHALAHLNLGSALGFPGKLEEAIACYRQAIKLDPKEVGVHHYLATAERMAAVQGKLPAFLKGEYKPRTSQERLGLADFCWIIKIRYYAAAGLYAEAFTTEPKLADDLKASVRYYAAGAAFRAGCGQGTDADNLDDQARALA